MKLAMVLCMLCSIAFAEVNGPVSNLVSTVSMWGTDPIGFATIINTVSFDSPLSENDCRTMEEWYIQITRAPISSNVTDYVQWSDLKRMALQVHAIAPGVWDSSNVWFAVADARGELANENQHAGETSTNGMYIVSTNLNIEADWIQRKARHDYSAAHTALIDGLSDCLDDFLRSRTYRSLSESERSSIRSNLLQRAGITEAEAAEMDL